MKVFLQSVHEEIVKSIREIEQPIAAAATAAMQQVADTAVAKGRDAIRAAGMSERVARPLTSRVYPGGGRVSMHPTALIFHKIGYFWVFEEGATIGGKPMLWLALPNVPLGNGGRPLRPKEYVARIGPLVSINNPGKPPMLFGRAGRGSILRATARSTRLRKGALSRGVFGELEPLYVGVASVTLRQQFGLYQIFQDAADRLPEFYVANVKDN